MTKVAALANITTTIQTADSDALLEWMDACKIASGVIESVKAEMRRRLEAEELVSERWMLVEGGTRRTVTDTIEAYKRLKPLLSDDPKEGCPYVPERLHAFDVQDQ